MRLYELAQDYKEFLQAIEDGLIPEDAINDSLESITALIEDKADNIACIIKNLEAEAKAIKEQEDILEERRKVKERRAKNLTEYLANTLLNSGVNKIETARNLISFRKSVATEIDNDSFMKWALENSRNDLLNFKDPTPNATAIKAAINNGAKIDGARVVTRQNIQIK